MKYFKRTRKFHKILQSTEDRSPWAVGLYVHTVRIGLQSCAALKDVVTAPVVYVYVRVIYISCNCRCRPTVVRSGWTMVGAKPSGKKRNVRDVTVGRPNQHRDAVLQYAVQLLLRLDPWPLYCWFFDTHLPQKDVDIFVYGVAITSLRLPCQRYSCCSSVTS